MKHNFISSSFATRIVRSLIMSVTFILSGCNGLFNDIYYTPESDGAGVEFGFISTDLTSNSGTIYIDATSYARWVFLDFHSFASDTANIILGQPDPDAWDIAVHRYDARTNGAVVMRTSYTSLSELAAIRSLPSGGLVPDIWTTDAITVDMSHMMDGWLEYAESFYNPELSSWLSVDTSVMPPIYALSPFVYVVRFADGSLAALKLRDYMSDGMIKGFMTIDYVYPLDLKLVP